MTGPEERCPITELPRNGCAHCRSQARPAPADDLTPDDVGATFAARYPGRCAVNDEHRIEVGDVIASLADGSGYACERCLP